MIVAQFRISLVIYAGPNTLSIIFLVLHELDYLSILDPNKKFSHGSEFLTWCHVCVSLEKEREISTF